MIFAGWGVLLFPLVLLSACGSSQEEVAKPAAPLRPPNVLVLAPDTVRGDHLSVNGYAKQTSPNLDRLAAEGVNFRNTATVAPRTWQSFSSILTGRYPPNHGVRFIYDEPIRPGVPILGSFLSQFGYESVAFDNVPFIEGMTGGRGFDHFLFPRRDATAHQDRLIFERASKWIFGERDKPWFAFIRFSGGHWPYPDKTFMPADQQCSEHDHSFNVGTYGIQRSDESGGGVDLTNVDAFKRLIWSPDETTEQREHRIAHYDSELHYSDSLMGELLDRLRRAGMFDNTIVVVTSDHGESFGEHGYLQHGPRVDESVMQVPLVLKLHKEHEASAEGLQVTAQVRTIDIFPTVADALGFPQPSGMDGVSLLPLIRALKSGEDVEERFAYGESGRAFMGVDPERYLLGVAGKHRMLRSDRWKLIQVPGAEREFRLYDLQNDRAEALDVGAEHPEIVARMAEKLARVDQVQGAGAKDLEPTPDQIENLRRMGYVQ